MNLDTAARRAGKIQAMCRAATKLKPGEGSARDRKVSAALEEAKSLAQYLQQREDFDERLAL